jgi:hypothetical protein
LAEQAEKLKAECDACRLRSPVANGSINRLPAGKAVDASSHVKAEGEEEAIPGKKEPLVTKKEPLVAEDRSSAPALSRTNSGRIISSEEIEAATARKAAAIAVEMWRTHRVIHPEYEHKLRWDIGVGVLIVYR